MSTPEENKEIVRRYQEALNRNDLGALDTLVASDIALPASVPGFPAGIEGVKQIHQATVEAWPDLKTEIVDMIAEGDKVAARIVMTATPQKPLMGVPPTGKSFRMNGMYVVRIANGKIVEHRGVEDAVGMLQQLGVMPKG
jgi:steroid delta-isomerase-like uncharacterized protein